MLSATMMKMTANEAFCSHHMFIATNDDQILLIFHIKLLLNMLKRVDVKDDDGLK